MKPVLKVCAIAVALLSPMVLFAQTPTLSCRPLPSSNTFIQPDEQIVGNQICKIVVSPASSSQPTQTAKLANDPPSPSKAASAVPVSAAPVAASTVESAPKGGSAGSLVWMDAQNSYTSYLEAAVLKKRTPVEFTTDRTKANYIATVTGFSKKGSASHEVMTGLLFGVPTSGAENSLALSVSDARSGAVVFSYTCKKTGKENFQSSSECLAKHWAHFMKNER